MYTNNKPKVSIIIACLNVENTIKKTIESIIKQDYNNIEIVIIDGKSKDGTLNVLKSFEKNIYKIVSEKDKSLGDAWNKGLLITTGEIIGILNAGDYYDTNIISKVVSSFINIPKPVIGYGDTTFFDNDKILKRSYSKKSFSKFSLLNGFPFMHPSVFFTKSIIENIGVFDINKKIAMDTDWLLRAKFNNVYFEKIPSHTYMELGGMSNVYQYTGMGEYLDSLVKYGITKYQIILFFVFRTVGSFKKLLKI